MLLKLGSVWLPRAPMEVEIKLDQEDSVYTPRDTISGEVVLHSDSAADLSTVVLKLSGTATSRLSHTNRTETHQVLTRIIVFSDNLISTNHAYRFSKSHRESFLQMY